VPKPLFQGSLLLGSMTKLLLPSELLNGREVRERRLPAAACQPARTPA
jgi:hypothetical protein